MAVTLTSKFAFILNALYADPAQVHQKQSKVDSQYIYNLASGVGANQADKLYAETRTIAASGNFVLDLAGVLTDIYGAALTFARVKGIFIFAAAANTNNVLMGAAAATQFIGPLGSATDVVNVRPGGAAVFIAPDATGWAVGAGTTDNLKFANSAAGSGVTYDLVIVGASA